MTARADSESGGEQARSIADAVARRSYGKLVAFLAARTGDLAAAEDALAEAFLAALVDWPRNGCPENPEAWLLTVARRKGIDLIRQRRTHESALEERALRDDRLGATPVEPAIPDHRLALMFACAHPAIEPAIRAPLILQVVLGVNAATIASAFLMSPATMGQRLVRAKNKIKQAGIPFQIPERDELAGRLDAVLAAIYASFAEGWTDPGGTDVARRNLAEEALFLGRLVAELLPQEPEALGLLALMLHAEARRHARRNPRGAYVPLAEQDTSLWDRSMIDAAEVLLLRASTMGSIGRYQLEGALQSAHVHRCREGRANWPVVVQLYDALLALTESPVVAINRALALAEIDGADAALQAIDEIGTDPRLTEYQPYWAARAELLAKVGATAEARRSYEIAIGLEGDAAVRHFLQQRQSALMP
jgi:RNA polymerase sigma-70 factor (ECF subfamily)